MQRGSLYPFLNTSLGEAIYKKGKGNLAGIENYSYVDYLTNKCVFIKFGMIWFIIFYLIILTIGI